MKNLKRNSTVALVVAMTVIAVAAHSTATAQDRSVSAEPPAAVVFDCLDTRQQEFYRTTTSRGFGAAIMPYAEVAHCALPLERALEMNLCEPGAFREGCIVPATLAVTLDVRSAQIAIINPDSMHPELLVGANPTPYP